MDVAHGSLGKAPVPPEVPRPHLLKIDTSTDESVGRLEFDDYLAALRVGPDGLVLASEFRFPGPDDGPGPVHGRVHVVDGATMRLLGSVDVDSLPFTTRLSPDGATAYVANVGTGTVSVIDVASRTLRATLENQRSDAVLAGTHGMCVVPAR